MTQVQRAVLWHSTEGRPLPPDLSDLFVRLSYGEMIDIKSWLARDGYMKFSPECGWHLTAAGRNAMYEKNRVRVVTRRTPCTL